MGPIRTRPPPSRVRSPTLAGPVAAYAQPRGHHRSAGAASGRDHPRAIGLRSGLGPLSRSGLNGVSEHPTPADQARRRSRARPSCNEIIAGFPFVDEASKSVALALLITPLIRYAVRAAPLTGVSAPKMGSGKTLLSHLPAYIATGRAPALISQADDPNEEKKRLLALLLEGSLVTVLDNCERPSEVRRALHRVDRDHHPRPHPGLHPHHQRSDRNHLDRHRQRSVDRRRSVEPDFAVYPRSKMRTAGRTRVPPSIFTPKCRCAVASSPRRRSRSSRRSSPPTRRDRRSRCLGGSKPGVASRASRWSGWAAPIRARRAALSKPATRCATGSATCLRRGTPFSANEKQTVAAAISATEPEHIVAAITKGDGSADALQALRNALEAVGDDRGKLSARWIGKFLAKHEGRIERGYRADQAGRRSNAVLWSVILVSLVSSSQRTRKKCQSPNPRNGGDSFTKVGGTNSPNSPNSPNGHHWCGHCGEPIDPGAAGTTATSSGEHLHNRCVDAWSRS